MIIYLDYVDKEKYRWLDKEYVQVEEYIFNSEDEATDYLITKVLKLDKSLVGSYNIDGKYQLLPKNSLGESKYFRINRNISRYRLDVNITAVKDAINNREVLRASYSLNNGDDLVGHGMANSTDLNDLIDIVRIELYKLGICKYNSNISVNITVESNEELTTFSVKVPSGSDDNVYRFRDFTFKKSDMELESTELFKSGLKLILNSSISSAFGDYNPEINLDNLLVTIKYGNE